MSYISYFLWYHQYQELDFEKKKKELDFELPVCLLSVNLCLIVCLPLDE